MIAAIVGSRTGLDWREVERLIDHILLSGRITAVVSGGAIGVDSIAERSAAYFRIPVFTLRPDWSRGRRAGIERNKEIVSKSDVVFAFWNGKSRGTKSTIDFAVKQGKPVKIWTDGAWVTKG